MGGSPGLSWVALSFYISLPLGAGGSSGHGELSWTHVKFSLAQGALLSSSWPCVRSTSARGALLATPGGLSWPPRRGRLVPTALTLGKARISFSPCYPAVGQRWGGTDNFQAGTAPRVTHSTSQTWKCSGLSSLGGRGSAPALLSSLAVTETKLNYKLVICKPWKLTPLPPPCERTPPPRKGHPGRAILQRGRAQSTPGVSLLAPPWPWASHFTSLPQFPHL